VRGRESHFAGIVRCEDAIGDDGVEMEIQVEGATEPLNVVDRRALGRLVGAPPNSVRRCE
jgi:hypothetical protein